MSDYLEVTIDVFGEADQQAAVRKTLVVRELIEEILREFSDLDRRAPDAYALYLEGSSKALDRDKTLPDQQVVPNSNLVFGWASDLALSWTPPAAAVLQPGRQTLSGLSRATLQDEKSRKIFPIQWQPAIIGRPDVDPTHNELLLFNAERLANGRRVSRRHAQITEQEGQYFIESLNERNPTYLNNSKEPISGRTLLQSGDLIRLGESTISLLFDVRERDRNQVQLAQTAPLGRIV